MSPVIRTLSGCSPAVEKSLRRGLGTAGPLHRVGWIWSLLLVICLGSPTSGGAQLLGLTGGASESSPAASPEQATDPAAEPQPSTLAEILREREAFRRELRALGRLLSSPAVDRAQELDVLEERVRTVLGDRPDERIDEASFNELLDLRTELESDLAETRRLAEAAEAELTRWETALEKVTEQLADWSRVTLSLDERGAPAPLRLEVERMVEEAEQIRDAIRARRDGAVAGFQRALELGHQLEVLEEQIDGLSSARREENLANRSQPIWRVQALQPGQSAGALLGEDLDQVEEHVRRYQWRLLFWAALGFVVALVLLRFAVPRGEDAEATPRLSAMLRRRGSILILGAVGFLWLFGPPEPPVVRLAMLWLTIIPATRLLIAAFGRQAMPLALGGLLVVLAHPLHRYLEGLPLLQRLFWVLETGGLSLLLGWRLARGRWNELIPGARWRLLARGVVAVSAVCLGLSALAAFFGSVVLARNLGDAVVATVTLSGYVLSASLLAMAGSMAALENGPLNRLRIARLHSERVVRGARRTIALVGLVVWAAMLIPATGIGRFLPQQSSEWLDVGFTLGSIHVSVGRIALFFLVFAVAMMISRFIRFALDEEVLPAVPLEQGLEYAISATVHYLLVFAGFVLAALAAGIDLTHATFLVGAFTVGLGFGLQNVVNNFVSGLILMYERPIQVGDIVEIGALMGKVERIGIRSSTVKSFQGSEVIVPNADLIAKEVVNWTLSNRLRRIELAIGVAYGSDPADVMRILQEAAEAQEKVQTDPAPSVLFTGFGDSSLDFELRCWVADIDDAASTASALRVDLERRLREAEIDIPFPHRTVAIASVPEGIGARTEG